MDKAAKKKSVIVKPPEEASFIETNKEKWESSLFMIQTLLFEIANQAVQSANDKKLSQMVIPHATRFTIQALTITRELNSIIPSERDSLKIKEYD